MSEPLSTAATEPLLVSAALLGGLVRSRREVAWPETTVCAVGDDPGQRPLEVREGVDAELARGVDEREQRAQPTRTLRRPRRANCSGSG